MRTNLPGVGGDIDQTGVSDIKSTEEEEDPSQNLKVLYKKLKKVRASHNVF